METVPFKRQEVHSGLQGEWTGRSEARGAEASVREGEGAGRLGSTEGRAMGSGSDGESGQLEGVQDSGMTSPSGLCDGGH